MPTPDWREEKAKIVIQSVCRVLALPNIPQPVRDELGHQALCNALKLFTNAIERLGSNETKWSPALVQLFMNKPGQCDQWLELMAEPEFTATDYWKRDDGK